MTKEVSQQILTLNTERLTGGERHVSSDPLWAWAGAIVLLLWSRLVFNSRSLSQEKRIAVSPIDPISVSSRCLEARASYGHIPCFSAMPPYRRQPSPCSDSVYIF